MSFFEPPVKPKAPGPTPASRRPPWAGPPDGVLGALVTDRTVVFRSPDVVVCLEHLRAYPEGFEFRIVTHLHHGRTSASDFLHGVVPGPVDYRLATIDAHGAVRLGMAWPDDRRLTDSSPLVAVPPSSPGPLLVQLTAGRTGGRWDQRYWVWTLPSPGPLALVVLSERFGVPETRIELDGEGIRSAAARAEILWADGQRLTEGLEPPVEPRLVFAPEPRATEAGPDDEEGARRAIESAFAGMQHVESDELVFVEGGESLTPTLRALHQRIGVSRSAVHTVERVVFVDPLHAAVWISVWVGTSPFLLNARGGAVFEDGRWKVSRDTFCGLMARAGVPCV